MDGICRAAFSAPYNRMFLALSRIALMTLLCSTGCTTLRTTDPPRTATEQFLMSGAVTRAVEQLSATALRDRLIWIDSTYLGTSQGSAEQNFLLGELRSRLLMAGCRLVDRREESQLVLEVRSGGIGIDRYEFLLGLPGTVFGNNGTTVSAGSVNIPLTTPELAIVKSTKQKGYAGVAFVAYWRDTGEVVASSGPYIGRTLREDYWFFGYGPRTVGNIPPAER